MWALNPCPPPLAPSRQLPQELATLACSRRTDTMASTIPFTTHGNALSGAIKPCMWCAREGGGHRRSQHSAVLQQTVCVASAWAK
eukprot:365617-Chlamydomonas_euryale.AAC.6